MWYFVLLLTVTILLVFKKTLYSKRLHALISSFFLRKIWNWVKALPSDSYIQYMLLLFVLLLLYYLFGGRGGGGSSGIINLFRPFITRLLGVALYKLGEHFVSLNTKSDLLIVFYMTLIRGLVILMTCVITPGVIPIVIGLLKKIWRWYKGGLPTPPVSPVGNPLQERLNTLNQNSTTTPLPIDSNSVPGRVLNPPLLVPQVPSTRSNIASPTTPIPRPLDRDSRMITAPTRVASQSLETAVEVSHIDTSASTWDYTFLVSVGTQTGVILAGVLAAGLVVLGGGRPEAPSTN